MTSQKTPEALHSASLVLLDFTIVSVKALSTSGYSCADKETGVSLAPRKRKQRRHGKNK